MDALLLYNFCITTLFSIVHIAVFIISISLVSVIDSVMQPCMRGLRIMYMRRYFATVQMMIVLSQAQVPINYVRNVQIVMKIFCYVYTCTCVVSRDVYND